MNTLTYVSDLQAKMKLLVHIREKQAHRPLILKKVARKTNHMIILKSLKWLNKIEKCQDLNIIEITTQLHVGSDNSTHKY